MEMSSGLRSFCYRSRFIVLGFLIVSSFTGLALAQGPEIDSWLLNCTNLTGYNGLTANVKEVAYTSTLVYIHTSGIPEYSIGPWPANPATPADQDYIVPIPRSPQVNTGTKTATPLGNIGFWINGVPVFNAKDAASYNNLNIWHQDAVVVEASSFDSCLGHPAPGMGPGGNSNGRYHHHQNPLCLYTDNPSEHSPLLGFAYDGYPIYGPRGYANVNGTGGIQRMETSYQLRSITQRTTLPDGTVLSPSEYGPPVNGTYPLGYYIEDYEYVAGLGDLDEYNGRFSVTPEYPGGVYAYFVTIDSGSASAYPYVIGPEYYGIVDSALLVPGGDHQTIPSGATYLECYAGVRGLFRLLH